MRVDRGRDGARLLIFGAGLSLGRGSRAGPGGGPDGWAVLVPESLAYATIAGLPPVVGLYAAVPALVLYAAVGSSRHLVVGPMSATAALSAASSSGLADAGLADYVAMSAALAVVTGVLGVARRADAAGVPRIVHL